MLTRLICLVLGHRRCWLKVAGGYFLDSREVTEIWELKCARCDAEIAVGSDQEVREMIAHTLLRRERAGR